MMKLWNISLQHCIETTIQHQSEIWSIVISNDERYVYTGAADNQLRVWTLDEAGLEAHFENEQTETAIDVHGQIFKYQGSIQRQSHERALSLNLIDFEDSYLLFCTVGGDFYLLVQSFLIGSLPIYSPLFFMFLKECG
jgi:U3 small nucleolar RNA-associated protein 12